MYTASLLMIFDPILMALCFTAMILGARGVKSPWLGGIFVIYLGVRWVMRMWATHLVKKRLSRRYYEIKVVTMPSLNSLFKWDFIARVPGRNIVGSVDLLRKRLKILRRLHYIKEDMKKILVNSCLGRHFQQFTPFFHVFYEKHEDKVIGRFVDLRYYVKDRFLHNGTIVMNEDLDVEEAVFQPYSLSRRVYLSE
jgi:inner membrane protein